MKPGKHSDMQPCNDVPGKKCLQQNEGGGEAHFNQCLFRANEEHYGKSVKHKSFESDLRLSQKVGARQK